MDSSSLQDLGFTVIESPDGQQLALEISSVQLVNPLTRTPIHRVTFSLEDEKLRVIEPAELVGIAPLPLTHLQSAVDIEHQLLNAFKESIFHLRRRSAELQAIGLNPLAQPGSLELLAEVPAGNFSFVIAANRLGDFSIARALKDGRELSLKGDLAFDLSEFRHRDALAGYLSALAGELEVAGPAAPPEAVPPTVPAQDPRPFSAASLGELVSRFGPGAIFPPKSTLEVLVEIEVKGARYRFAAARVANRTFRGLLAGAMGKVWADRFELDQFPGVAGLVSEVLQVPLADVRLVSADKGV